MNRIAFMLLFTIFFCLLSAARPLWAETFAYIPSHDNNSVVRVDTDALSTDTVVLSDTDQAQVCRPYGAAVAPDGSYVIVTCDNIDMAAFLANTSFSEEGGTAVLVEVGGDPRGVAIDPAGRYAYVANYADDTVTVITTATRTVLSTIPVGDGQGGPISDGPWGIAAVQEPDTDTTKVYVANHLSNTISVITDNKTDIATIGAVGIGPIGLAAAPDGRRIYVAISNRGQIGIVRALDTSDDVFAALVNGGRGPWAVAVGSQGDHLYVTNNADNSVTVIQTSDFRQIGTIAVNAQPFGTAAPINGDFAYVITQGATGTDINKVDISTGLPLVTPLTSLDDPDLIQGAFALGAFIGGAPPAAPADLNGTAVSDRIDLTWTDNSDDELAFQIERRVQGQEDFVEIAQTAADVTTYTDQVADGRTYEYRIRAFNETSFSAYAASEAISSPQGEDFSWCFVGTLSGEAFGAQDHPLAR